MNVLKRAVRRVLPFTVQAFVRNAIAYPKDLLEDVLGTRDPEMPPLSLMYVGPASREEFKALGEQYVRYFSEICGLKRDASVLDIGCGVGRMAIPLTKYLSPAAHYAGFDIIKAGVDWCTRNITSRFPNFRFLHADIYNSTYNPRGQVSPARFAFPFESATFDFAFATSVFTHMLPDDVKHYLAEMRRVLKPGGKAFLTFFILNEYSNARMADHTAAMNFVPGGDSYWTIDPSSPETAVAYQESMLLDLLRGQGLVPESAVRYGSWSGREGTLAYQDIVIIQDVV